MAFDPKRQGFYSKSKAIRELVLVSPLSVRSTEYQEPFPVFYPSVPLFIEARSFIAGFDPEISTAAADG